jgi:TolB-like protein/class 3 adenylate cyclase/Flp pilus assembly protein TadD
MSEGRVERRLAAIMAADVAGYSRLMGTDEEGTLAALKAIRGELGDPKIAEHRGRIVKTTGDGLLVEFSSVVDAVRCAVEVQQGMAGRNADVPADKRIELRFGIHQGDIIIDDGDIFGDGVNLAARLEGLAEPGGICVSRVVRDEIRDKLDFTFDDMGEQSLKNIARPMRVFAVNIGAHVSRPPAAETGAIRPMAKPAPLALPDKPSLAVLPFQNMSGDPEQDYFADGMVEEIITALSRIRWLFVIARNSTFTYKGQSIDVKRVGRELGVRYVLEGSVRKAAGRVRITAQLIEAETGTHLWADRFDGSLEHVFDLQDQVAISVAGIIEPTLQAAEIRRVGDRPANDLTTYDLYLRALADHLSFEKERVLRAIGLLAQAVERNPEFGPALALAAWCHVQCDSYGWTDDLAANRRRGLDLAQQAVRAAGDDPGVLTSAAFAIGRFGDDIAGAVALIDRATQLNPGSAGAWHTSGWLRLMAGEPDLAIEHFQTSQRLSPRGQRMETLTGIGAGHVLAGRYAEAIPVLRVTLEEFPHFVQTYRYLASACANLGKLDEAREVVRRLRAITPMVVPPRSVVRNREQSERFLSGLRLAAGEAA